MRVYRSSVAVRISTPQPYMTASASMISLLRTPKKFKKPARSRCNPTSSSSPRPITTLIWRKLRTPGRAFMWSILRRGVSIARSSNRSGKKSRNRLKTTFDLKNDFVIAAVNCETDLAICDKVLRIFVFFVIQKYNIKKKHVRASETNENLAPKHAPNFRLFPQLFFKQQKKKN